MSTLSTYHLLHINTELDQTEHEHYRTKEFADHVESAEFEPLDEVKTA